MKRSIKDCRYNRVTTKHTFLVCGEPGSLSTFNIILLWEAFTVYHSLSLIKQCLCDTSSCVSSVSSLQISVFGVRSRLSVSVCWAQAAAQCTLITLGLSYRKLVAVLSFSQSWVTLYSSLVTSPTACYTWPVTAFPPIRLDNTDTDHWTHDVLAWVSPRDWRRWELSGGQGREGVHLYTDGCPVLRTVQCKRKVLLYLKYFSFEFMCNCSKHFTYSLVKDKHKNI